MGFLFWAWSFPLPAVVCFPVITSVLWVWLLLCVHFFPLHVPAFFHFLPAYSCLASCYVMCVSSFLFPCFIFLSGPVRHRGRLTMQIYGVVYCAICIFPLWLPAITHFPCILGSVCIFCGFSFPAAAHCSHLLSVYKLHWVCYGCIAFSFIPLLMYSWWILPIGCELYTLLWCRWDAGRVGTW